MNRLLEVDENGLSPPSTRIPDRLMTGTPPRIELFGTVRVVPPGAPPRLIPRPAARRVLSTLALYQSKPVARDLLIAEGWPGQNLGSPQAALRMTITRLRRAIGGPERVETIGLTGRGYRLLPQVESDTAEFRRVIIGLNRPDLSARKVLDEAARSLDLWRGQPHADCESVLFRTEQEQLANLRIVGFGLLVRAALTLGDPATAHGYLSGLIADNPYHDGLTALHMQILYAMEDQRGAIRAYEDYRVRLLEETGLQPTPDLEELQRRILRHELRLPGSSSSNGTTAPGLAWIVSMVTTSSPDIDQGPDRFALEPIRRAEVCASLGHWDEASSWFLRSIETALSRGDEEAAVDYCLRMAHVVWDHDLGEITVDQLHRLAEHHLAAPTAARIQLCLAGGMFRTGYDASRTERHSLDASISVLERSGRPEDLAWGLTHYRDALIGELTESEALAVTDRVIALEIDDPLLRGQTARARFAGLLRSGRPAQAGVALRAILREADGNAANRFGAHTATNCWNLAVGRWGPVQEGLELLLQFKGRLGASTVDDVLLAQSLCLCREVGDQQAILAHREGALALAASEPTQPHWPVAAALLAADSGQWEQAVAEMTNAIDAFGLTEPESGAHRIGILALVAEVLAAGKANGASADRSVASSVLAALLDEDCQGVLLGWPVAYLGSKQRFVGFAAFAAGDWHQAEIAIDIAIHQDRWLPALSRRSLMARALINGRRRSVDAARADQIHRSLLIRSNPLHPPRKA